MAQFPRPNKSSKGNGVLEHLAPRNLRRMVVKTFPDRNKRSPRCSHAYNTESKPLISRVMGGLYYCWRVANRRSSKKKHLFGGAKRFSLGGTSEESRVSCFSILRKRTQRVTVNDDLRLESQYSVRISPFTEISFVTLRQRN